MEISSLNVRMAEPTQAMLDMDKEFLRLLRTFLNCMIAERFIKKYDNILSIKQLEEIRKNTGISRNQAIIVACYERVMRGYMALFQECFQVFEKEAAKKPSGLAKDGRIEGFFKKSLRVIENEKKSHYPKMTEFKNLILSSSGSKIVFMESPLAARWLKRGFENHEVKAEVIYGESSDSFCEKTFAKFQGEEISAIITTARCEKIFQLPTKADMVINYSIPAKRIDREARANLAKQGDQVFYICLNHMLDRIRLFGKDDWDKDFQPALF